MSERVERTRNTGAVRTAIVTGAGSGIGFAIAERLADDGLAVACAEYSLETGVVDFFDG